MLSGGIIPICLLLGLGTAPTSPICATVQRDTEVEDALKTPTQPSKRGPLISCLLYDMCTKKK